MTKKILITGASGGLGQILKRHFEQRFEVTGLCFTQAKPDLIRCDLTQAEPIADLVQTLKPDYIIHTVALTDVDRCDRDLALAFDLNVRSSLHVRLAAQATQCPVIHISTNDVFEGTKGLYSESDQPLPINFYAKSKYMAEEVFYKYPHALVLRFTFLSWYASGKNTFANWIVDSLKAGKTISLYQDQFYSPLDITTAAEWIEALLDAKGVYHLGSQRRSRYETALAIAEALRLNSELIQPGWSNQFAVSAPRPADVSLDCTKVQEEWGLSTEFDFEVKKLIQSYRP